MNISISMTRMDSWNVKNSYGSSESNPTSQGKRSLASELLLPPISEVTKGATTQNTASVNVSSLQKHEMASTQVASERDINERTSNRASVSSVASVESDSNLKGNARKSSLSNSNSPSRRDSVKRETAKRRVSVSNLLQVGRKTSFSTIGAKVSTLIKARNAFTRLKKSKDETGDAVDEAMLEIKELPKSPRFASTLSVEAQYAMMKGYEDIVYNNLYSSYPECRTVLKRNRTPISGVQMRTSMHQRETGGGNISKREGNRRTPVNSAEHRSASTVATGTSGQGKPELYEEKTNVSHTDAPLTVKHSAYNRSALSCKSSHTHSHGSPSRHRNISHLVPKEKQLVLTYRYQSAMDILDTVRTHTGVHTLSPRVKHILPTIEPVKEFNSWALVWNKEFELKSTVAKT